MQLHGCPPGSATPARRVMAVGSILDDQVDLVATHFPDTHPPELVTACVRHGSDGHVLRAAHSLLAQIGADPRCLDEKHLLKLSKTKWFSDFFANAVIRSVPTVQRMGFENVVELLVKTCPHQPPLLGTPGVFATGVNGERVLFEPTKALAFLADQWNKQDGPSKVLKERLKVLPWVDAWLASMSYAGENETKKACARLVPKEAKITILKTFYRRTAPTWKDYHRIRVSETSVWTFRPLQWVDDTSNMWLGGEKRVRLTPEEMKEVEKCEWFENWLQEKRSRRKLRSRSKARIQAPTERDLEQCVGSYVIPAMVIEREDAEEKAW